MNESAHGGGGGGGVRNWEEGVELQTRAPATAATVGHVEGWATSSSELEKLDAPALRALVAGLTSKLGDFARANKANAEVAAEQLLRMSARVEEAEARAEAGEKSAREAREAGEAAGALLFREAGRLRDLLVAREEEEARVRRVKKCAQEAALDFSGWRRGREIRGALQTWRLAAKSGGSGGGKQ